MSCVTSWRRYGKCSWVSCFVYRQGMPFGFQTRIPFRIQMWRRYRTPRARYVRPSVWWRGTGGTTSELRSSSYFLFISCWLFSTACFSREEKSFAPVSDSRSRTPSAKVKTSSLIKFLSSSETDYPENPLAIFLAFLMTLSWLSARRFSVSDHQRNSSAPEEVITSMMLPRTEIGNLGRILDIVGYCM